MKIVLYLKECLLAPVEPVSVHTLLKEFRQLEVDPCFLHFDNGLDDLISFYELGVVQEDAHLVEKITAKVVELADEYEKAHEIPAFDAIAPIFVPTEFESYFRPIKPNIFRLDGTGSTSINQFRF